jgi:YidC/Oxa1 family membrane protein insertase
VEKRLLIFLPIAFAVLYISAMIDAARKRANQPPPPDAVAQHEPVKGAGDHPAAKNAADKGGDAGQPGKNAAKNPAEVKAAPPAEKDKAIPDQWITLGSVAPPGKQDPFVGLWTFTNRGAAVERVELADERYRDLENRFGYLGQLALVADKESKGCRVNVVGEGTPAAAAGIEVGDVIVDFQGEKTPTPSDLFDLLKRTAPSQVVPLTVLRDGAPKKLSVTLGRRPLEVIRPEWETDPIEQSATGEHDPLSFLTTLHDIDDDEIAADSDHVSGEIDGVHLRTDNWEGKKIGNDTVEFVKQLPKWNLEVVKRYILARIPEDQIADSDPYAYHLILHIEIRNLDKKAHSIAYQQDGATGLPLEGWWYASRITPDWGAVAIRNTALKFEGNSVAIINSLPIAQKDFEIAQAKGKDVPKRDDIEKPQKENDQLGLQFAGVDAQYFAAVMLPQHVGQFTPWFADIRSVIVGTVPTEAALRKKVNSTCRLTSVIKKLEPGDSLKHDYQVFVGPKLPALLEQYTASIDKKDDLGGLVYYGWFGWVARPMVAILGIFHTIVRNYGLAIIMLTVMVRLCMFPLSRKQALATKKMQELQPEMKKINEKYKTNAQERTRATQELWRKHNYNPLGGCLLVFVQLPIFMGLYRSLMVNVQLRGAGLLGEAVRWCSNLAAPDMFMNWTGFMPDMLASKTGWLGPYLNVLPLITVAFFIWQQKMFMPPATDDNTALQQKIMKYMTLFMGVMFFKVAAGLCLYFIASSMWGIGERKLLPRMTGTATPGATAAVPARAAPSSNGNTAGGRKKQRGRK